MRLETLVDVLLRIHDKLSNIFCLVFIYFYQINIRVENDEAMDSVHEVIDCVQSYSGFITLLHHRVVLD